MEAGRNKKSTFEEWLEATKPAAASKAPRLKVRIIARGQYAFLYARPLNPDETIPGLIASLLTLQAASPDFEVTLDHVRGEAGQARKFKLKELDLDPDGLRRESQPSIKYDPYIMSAAAQAQAHNH